MQPSSSSQVELGEILDLHYEKEMKVTTLRVAPLTIYAALSGNLLAKWSPEMIEWDPEDTDDILSVDDALYIYIET